MPAPAAAAGRSLRELRRFGLTVGAAFVLLALISAWRGHSLPPRVLGVAGAFLLVGALAAPRLLEPVERGWMRFAEVLGRVNTRIVLTLVYCLVITPAGVLRRWVNDPLDRRMRDGRPSVWVARPRRPVDPARYRQQF
jgi:saxitoxin biosynthesis operon SxtJ-like protein